MMRTYEHIHGDLVAAQRRVECLTAELAGVQPSTLTLTSRYEKVSLKASQASAESNLDDTHVILSSQQSLCGQCYEAAPLRDWLNFHFPAT